MPSSSESSIQMVDVRNVVRRSRMDCYCGSPATFRRRLEELPLDSGRLAAWLDLTLNREDDSRSQESSVCKSDLVRRDGGGSDISNYGDHEDQNAQDHNDNNNNTESTATLGRTIYSPTTASDGNLDSSGNSQQGPKQTRGRAGFLPQSPTPSDQFRAPTSHYHAFLPAQAKIVATHDSRDGQQIRRTIDENAPNYYSNYRWVSDRGFGNTADDGLHATGLLPTEGKLTREYFDPSVDGHSGYLADGSDLEDSDALTKETNMPPKFGDGGPYTHNAPVGGTARSDGMQKRAGGHSLGQRPTDRNTYGPDLLRRPSTPKIDSPFAVVITSPSPYSKPSQSQQSLAGIGNQFEGLQTGRTAQHRGSSTSRIVPPPRLNNASRIVPPPKRTTPRTIENPTPPVGYDSSDLSFTPLVAGQFKNEPPPALPKKRGRPFRTAQAAAKAASKAAAKSRSTGSAPTGQVRKRKRRAEASKADSSDGEPKRRGRSIIGRRLGPVKAQYVPFICEWKGCPAELHNLETLRRHVYIIHYKWQKTGMACLWGKCGASGETGKEKCELGSAQKEALFMTKADWKEHVEECHLIPFSWHMGDGPKAPSLSGEVERDPRVFEPWLYDASGRQVTPSVRDQRVEGGDARFNNFRRYQKLVRQGVYSVSESTSSSGEAISSEAATDSERQASRKVNTINDSPGSGNIMIVPSPVKRPQDYQKDVIVISDDEDDLAPDNNREGVADSDDETDRYVI